MTIAVRDHATLIQRIAEAQGGGGGGGGAPTTATYVTLSTDATLTAERVLTAGHGIDITDGGAGTTVTIAVDEAELDAPIPALVAGTWTGAASITTLGTIATGVWTGTAIAVANGGTGSTTASGARSNLGLAIGTDVQAWDADLDTLAAVSSTDHHVWRRQSGTWAYGTLDAASIATGTIAAARLGTMSGAATKYQVLCADGVYRVRGGPTVAGVTWTSDTTLRTTGLTMSGLSVGHYDMRVKLRATAPGTAALKIQVLCTNATADWRMTDRDSGADPPWTEASTPTFPTATSERFYLLEAQIEVTSATGTVDIQLAQNASNATPLTLVRGTMDMTERA